MEQKRNMEKKEKCYERMSMLPVASIPECQVLTSSIINNAKIISTGQELGPTYDLSNEADDNTGKTFSHEWNQGN